MGSIRPASYSEMFFCSGKTVKSKHTSKIIVNSISIRYSLLPALSIDGIISAKIVEGSFTKPLFIQFIADLLTKMQPFLGRNFVIVMDNARIHKIQEIINMIHERYLI